MREGEKDKEDGKNREKADFFAYFGPDFPLLLDPEIHLYL